MADDLVASALQEIDRISKGVQAKEAQKEEDKDPSVWVGGGSFTPGGREAPKVSRRLSQMQQDVLAAGAVMSPEYQYYENALIKGRFMSKSYAGKPQFAAGALEFAAKLYNAYAAKGGDKPFPQWLDWYANSMPKDERGGGRGGYSGPRAQVSYANEGDLRRTADALGAELLGRAVSDDEFEKVLKRVRSAESSEPTVTSGSGATSVTQTGISAEGRGDIMRDILAKGPEAEEFTKATKVMGMFNEWLERRAG